MVPSHGLGVDPGVSDYDFARAKNWRGDTHAGTFFQSEQDAENETSTVTGGAIGDVISCLPRIGPNRRSGPESEGGPATATSRPGADCPDTRTGSRADL